MKHELI